MRLPSWLTLRHRCRDSAAKASPTACPKCGAEMVLEDRSTMSGDDMRTYRCGRCQDEHIVNFGTATWKILSDARNSDT